MGFFEDNYQSDSLPSNDTKSRVKWEYKEITINPRQDNTNYLNEFGEQGWEMCGYDGEYGVAVFKRIKR